MTPQEILTDDEIERVHAHANFGPMAKRDVVAEGVLKTTFGYHCGSTQLNILQEHGLVRRLKPGSRSTTLTAKGMRYLQASFGGRLSDILKPQPAQGAIAKIASVSESLGRNSGEPSIEFAGAIVSHLAAHPEDIETFMREGVEMMIDGRLTLISGCLSHRCNDGEVRQSRELRELLGTRRSLQ